MSVKPIVLVIEGSAGEGETLTRALHAEHYHTIITDNPQDALDYLEAPLDLVLSGVGGAQGRDLMQSWIRRRPETPFVVLTNQHAISEGEAAMESGAAGFIVAPFDSSEAVARISQLAQRATESTNHEPNSSRDQSEGADIAHAPDRTAIRIPPGTTLEDLERAAVEQALVQHQGNRTHAAKELGISVRTLQRKLKAWGGMQNPKNPSAGENRMPASKSWNASQPAARGPSFKPRLANV
jgi:DNA-binding NtrC family response regulator